MGNADVWNNLPGDLMTLIAQKLDLPGNIKLSGVSKSWKSATSMWEVLPSKGPYLLLAEDSGAAPTVTDDVENKISDDEDTDEEEYDEDTDEDFDEEDGIDGYVNIHHVEIEGDGDNYEADDKGIQVNNDTYINTRGLFCLSTGRTYNIDLPEANGRLILGTNKGWLLTLGRDLKINLLHPFSKHQVALPPMLTLPCQYDYDDSFPPQECFHMFITKVAMSSTVPTSGDGNPLPVIMAIYGEFRIPAFARLGDKIWTDVKTDAGGFNDVVYHKKKFYAVTDSKVYECEVDVDDDDVEKRGPRTTEIASLPLKPRMYTRPCLVESSSGHDLLLIVRFRRGEPYRSVYTRKYYTSKFLLWKLEQTNSEHSEVCNWKPVTNLGNESLFIGRTSSFSVSSSETIKPNCIYFTDDTEFYNYKGEGTGHDMGIFSIEHGTIEPHFRGKSIHPFSPPLWYI